MDKQQGISLIEFLISIVIISIVSLGYIKYYSDVQIFKKEQHIKQQTFSAAANYHNLLMLRVKETSLSYSNLKNYIDHFTNEDCQSDVSVVFEEFNMNFCHIIKTNQNATFNLEKCNDTLCIQYNSNRFKETDNCEDSNRCFNFNFWGITSKSDSIYLKKGQENG